MDQAKLQYTTDGKTWKDLELTGMNNSFAGVRNQNQEVSVAKEIFRKILKQWVSA